MKKSTLFIITCLTIYSCSTNAQPNPKEKDPADKSKLEAFSLKTGSLIKKEFKPLGTIKKVEVQDLTLTDVLSNTKVSGIKLETTVSRSYSTDTKSCFLDADEIESFLKSANYLINSINQPAELYTEFQFTSRDGFQAGCYKNKNEWNYFIKLEKYGEDSYVFLAVDEFKKLVELIKAKG